LPQGAVVVTCQEYISVIHVIAITTTRPGQRDAVLDLFRANVPAVQAEQGCIEYGAYTDMPDGPAVQALHGQDVFVVMEKWASMEALRAHIAAPHTAAYRERTKELVVKREIRILTPA
jgi:quinol monooxygenase YgiN